MTSVDTEASENTGVLVERLWEASDDTMAEVEEWHGTAPAAAPDPGKRRWPWVMAAVSLTAAALAVWALPNALQEREQSAVNDVAAAVGMAAAELSQMDHVATTIIDPAADTASLSGMAVDLTRIDTAARDLLDQAVVAQDLGLADAGEIGQAGELALSLERRLSTVLTYRLLIESSLVLPELPATTSADDLGDIARSLSEAITSIRTDVEALPRDELLDAHRSEAIDAVDALEADQASYLSALRDGDTESAAQVAATMRTRLGDIHDSLDRLLGSLTPWVDDTIAGIQSNLSG